MAVDEKLAEAVRRRTSDGRLRCAAAFEIAEELGVAPLEVGQAADALSVKIVACQLGCFGERRKRK